MLADNILYEEQQRQMRFKRAWDAYYGKLPKPLKVRLGQPDDNVQMNFSRVIVDKGVSFLFGQPITFELNEDLGSENPAEEYLEDVWTANKQATLLQKLAMNGGVCGHTFMKIVVGATPLPRLIVLDPATVTVGYQPDDIEEVVWYRIQYPAIDPMTGKAIAVRQVIQRETPTSWTIIDQISRSTVYVQNQMMGSWETVSQSRWPYAFPPIADCQNLPSPNEYWGISDLEEDVIGLNQSANFVLSNIARILRFHAHPRTWGKGFGGEQIKSAIDETIILPSKDAELHNLEMQSDLSSSIEFYNRVKEALHEVAKIPEIATGTVDKLGPLSGVALQVLYQPLLEKTEIKRRTYGDLINEINKRLLVIGGYGEDQEPAIHWFEMLPSDPLTERQALVIDESLGVSKDTILRKLGYDPDVELEKSASEDATLAEQAATMFDRGQGENVAAAGGGVTSQTSYTGTGPGYPAGEQA